MADISSYLRRILEAVYGEEVRGSIHDALAAMNVESNSAMNMAHTAQDSATAKAAEALASSIAAKTSEDNAKSSETNARTSEINAANSEAVALAKALEVAAAVAAALASETNAANSEAIAIQKAAEAEASKNAAAISESNVAAAETRVGTIKGEVETLGAQATQDKTDAEAARDAAQASQAAARTSELNAAASETAAENAKDAAETAQGLAEDAQGAAEAAQQAAETAQGLAEDARDAAATSATNAAASASTAQQYSGKPPKPENGTWWIWNATTGVYEDTHISCDLVGPTGNGIDSIVRTSGDHSPGTTDTYTVTMTDGTTNTFTVYNGRNGTGVGDIIGIAFDIVIPVLAWSDCEATIIDARFIANAKYKYLVDAYDESKTEITECKVKMKDITVTGEMSFTAEIDPINPITLNIIRLELGANAP